MIGAPMVVIDAKLVASAVARAALAGVVLHVTEDDHGWPLFIASKWNLTRQLHSLDEVQAFLRQCGAPDA